LQQCTDGPIRFRRGKVSSASASEAPSTCTTSPVLASAIFAFTVCFVMTIAVSLVTKPRAEKELVGLVYSLTQRPRSDGEPWYSRPPVLGACVLAGALVLNVIFW